MFQKCRYLQTLVELGLTDDWQHIIDSTNVRGHVSAAGGKGGWCECSWWVTRRLYEQNPRSLRQGLPIGFTLTGGEASDYTAAEALMAIPSASPKALLAGKGYDDRFRESLLVWGVLPIIPPRSNRKVSKHPNYRRYRDRNRVERMFAKLKQQRRTATRYDKLPSHSPASSTLPQRVFG